MEDPIDLPAYVSAGNRLLEVELIVGNISAESAFPSGGYLIDADGRRHEGTITWENPLISGYDVQAGQRERGWVGFEIPETARIAGFGISIGSVTLFSGLVPQPGTVPEPLPARTAPQYPALGEVVALDGYTLSVTELIDPAESVPDFFSAPGNIFVAKAGMRLVALRAVIENISGRQLYVYPGACLLIDTEGFIYPSAPGAVYNEMNSINLNPGDRTSGLIAFPIPPRAALEAVRCEIGAQGVITILVSGLTK